MTLTLRVRIRPLALLGLVLMLIATVAHASTSGDQPETPLSSPETSALKSMSSGSRCENIPLLMAEGSNSCEIMSCGMGIKDTCKITCPADKTPKCSCDCLKSFGPMCTEYKANCKCE